jgi:hypothetical protein
MAPGAPGSPSSRAGTSSAPSTVNDRVADEGRLDDPVHRHPGLRRHGRGQIGQGSAHGGRHLPVAAGIHHGVGDPAHQVLAEADLRVHQAG